MAYFPIMVDLEGKKVLIIGGGETAARKAEMMLEFGARVTVVTKELRAAMPEAINVINRAFRPEDISCPGTCDDTAAGDTGAEETFGEEPFLIIAATDDRKVNEEVARLAMERHIPINVVDDEPLCSFTFPAVIRDRDVVVSVSSGGKSPLVTQHVKKQLLAAMPPHIGEINDEMGELRKRIRETVPGQKERKQIYKEELERLLNRE